MYKKKLATRALTAVATGALLVSSVTVAMATGNETAVNMVVETDEEESAGSVDEAADADEDVALGAEEETIQAVEEETQVLDTKLAKAAKVAYVNEPKEELTEQIASVQFVCDGEVVGGGDYFVMADEYGYFALSQLEGEAPEGYTFDAVGDGNANYTVIVEVTKVEEEKEELTEQIANVQFVCDGEVVGGGDYFVMADEYGYFALSQLEGEAPEGYTFDAVGDGNTNYTVVVEVTKVEEEKEELTEQIANVQFVCDGEVVGGGDYFVMADEYGYFALSQLKGEVPEGYTFDAVGDGNTNYTVVVEVTKVEEEKEELTEQIAHVQFVYEGEVVAGGDYFVMADADGVFDLEELKQYVPEGYTFTRVGEDSVKTPAIVIDLTKVEEETELTEQIAHVQFVYEGEVVAGGDYFVMADVDGVFDLEELKQYVPEGYTFTRVGDESVKTPQIVIDLTKVEEETELTEQIAHVQFVYEGEVVAGGDYFVMADADGVFDLEELKQYVPEGYTFTRVGDESVKTPQIVIDLTKVEEETELTEQIAHVQFVYEGEVVAGGDYFVMADADGVFNLEELKQYVPEGYTFTRVGDESVKTPQIVIELTKDEEPQPQPEENADAKIIVHFTDADGNVQGEVELVKTGKEGEMAVFTVADLAGKLPEGFKLTDSNWTVSVSYGQDGGIVKVNVDKIEVPTPTPQQLTSTVTIEFVYGTQVRNSQVLHRTGNEGETFTVTREDVEVSFVPSGYYILSNGYFADTEVAYGENVTLQVRIARTGNGGGGSIGGGGSSSSVGGSGRILSNGNWQQNETGWWYSYANGTYAKSGWYTLEWQGKTDWYFFDDNGYLVSGWLDNNGNRYYLHDVHDGTFGRMYSGWNKIQDKWHYFNDSTTEGVFGALVADAVVPEELN